MVELAKIFFCWVGWRVDLNKAYISMSSAHFKNCHSIWYPDKAFYIFAANAIDNESNAIIMLVVSGVENCMAFFHKASSSIPTHLRKTQHFSVMIQNGI